MPKERGNPRYTGMRRHIDPGGFAFWYPSDWHRTDMVDGHQGVIYSPYSDGFDTSFSAEKQMLKFAVHQSDVPTLRDGFAAGLQALPGIEVESQDETITSTVIFSRRGSPSSRVRRGASVGCAWSTGARASCR